MGSPRNLQGRRASVGLALSLAAVTLFSSGAATSPVRATDSATASATSSTSGNAFMTTRCRALSRYASGTSYGVLETSFPDFAHRAGSQFWVKPWFWTGKTWLPVDQALRPINTGSPTDAVPDLAGLQEWKVARLGTDGAWRYMEGYTRPGTEQATRSNMLVGTYEQPNYSGSGTRIAGQYPAGYIYTFSIWLWEPGIGWEPIDTNSCTMPD